MFVRQDRDALERELKRLDAEIAAHPLVSEPVRLAREIIAAHDDRDKEAIDEELKVSNLPSLEELGKIVASETVGWWKLHRKRNKLLAKLERV